MRQHRNRRRARLSNAGRSATDGSAAAAAALIRRPLRRCRSRHRDRSSPLTTAVAVSMAVLVRAVVGDGQSAGRRAARQSSQVNPPVHSGGGRDQWCRAASGVVQLSLWRPHTRPIARTAGLCVVQRASIVEWPLVSVGRLTSPRRRVGQPKRPQRREENANGNEAQMETQQADRRRQRGRRTDTHAECRSHICIECTCMALGAPVMPRAATGMAASATTPSVRRSIDPLAGAACVTCSHAAVEAGRGGE